MKVVYDLRSQPFSVGDVLLYQQVSLILTDEAIDFIVSIDPERPVVADKHLAYINKNNFREHLEWLMPAARVNPLLRSSSLSLKKEWGWPNKNHYMYYECLEIIGKCFKHREIPELKPTIDVSDFLEKHGRTTIQMRRNPHWVNRNSDYEVWLEFLSKRKEKFIIVCAPHEVDDRLRLENVTIASDYFGQDTEKICALIGAADFHMGVNSGPMCMRLFSKKPFCVFKDYSNVSRIPSLHKSGDGIKFDWSTENQTMLPFAETVARIEAEYEKCS